MNRKSKKKCKAITQKGRRCELTVVNNSCYCHIHTRKCSSLSSLENLSDEFLHRLESFEYRHDLLKDVKQSLEIYSNIINHSISEITLNSLYKFIETLRNKKWKESDIQIQIVLLSNFLQFLRNKLVITNNPATSYHYTKILDRLGMERKEINMLFLGGVRWADGFPPRHRDDQSRYSEQGLLRTLYFPYARSLNTNFLKRMVLVFDEIWFIDPLARQARELISYSGFDGFAHHDGWNTIKEEYDILYESGICQSQSPIQITRDHDILLRNAVTVDLTDNHFMMVCRKELSRDYWGIYEGKITAQIEELPRKLYRPERIDIFSPFEREERKYTIHCFDSRFMFNIAHNYVKPPLGLSFNVNLALLASELWNIPLITDSPLAAKMLDLKYSRALKNMTESDPQLCDSLQLEYPHGVATLTANIAAELIPDKVLEGLTFADIIQIRNKHRSDFIHFRKRIAKLSRELSHYKHFFDRNLIIENATNKLIHEYSEMQECLAEYMDCLKLAVGNVAIPAGAYHLAAHINPLLSPGELLALSTTALVSSIGMSLPNLLEAWRKKRKARRNPMAYFAFLNKVT